MFIVEKLLWKLKIRKYIKQLKTWGSNSFISFPITISIPGNLSVGNNVYLGPGAWISSYGEVRISNGTIIGPRIKIYTGNHNYESENAIPYDGLTIVKPVIINENVWIGGDVIILPGINIGEGAVIGAGSVVVKDVLPGAIIGGNPARVIKFRDMDLYFKLKKEDKIYLALKARNELKLSFGEKK